MKLGTASAIVLLVLAPTGVVRGQGGPYIDKLFETAGGPSGLGSTVASSLGIDLVVVGNNVSIDPGAVTGSAVASVDLDGNDDGTISILSSNLLLEDITGSAGIPFVADVNFAFLGVGVDVQIGATTVTGGAFTIDSSTPGGLTLNSGTVSIIGTALSQPVNEMIDLNDDPIGVDFADLGAATIGGTADDSLLMGDDQTPIYGHEIVINWAGASSVFNVEVGGTTLPIGVFLTGDGLSLGAVPEPGSGLFLTAAAVGIGGTLRRRRG